jgi:RNA polymerase sigma-70 factor (ECF subfamily)
MMSPESDPKGPAGPERPADELVPFPPPRDVEEEDGDAEEFSASLQSDANTRALVERAQAGDVEAMNDLFARYQGFMVEMARRRLGTRLMLKEDADDLAQTTFREATRDFRRYEYRGEGSLLRWLLQILHNKIRDKAEYYGATKRDVARERPAEERLGDSGDVKRIDPVSPDLTVTQTLAREEEFKILRAALGELSPDHRKAITLVFFQGLTLRQAGEIMEGRSEDAVRMLLRRAENHLRELTQARLGS